MNSNLKQLADAGVSIWLDDLSRERLNSGNLASLIADYSVTGVTTNPTIFAAALANGEAYAPSVAELKAQGADVAKTITALTTTDVRDACDLFGDVFQRSNGYDGRVSIEVDPRLARDTQGTIAQAQELHELVDRENVLIKIPATIEGLPAITATIAAGISVNVTLIFSLERYRLVMDAYLSGLEQASANGHDLSKIHSVASFFVSRVDSEVDKRLQAIDNPDAEPLKGMAGIANARLAYDEFVRTFAGPRWQALADKGANLQRPLWASTGVKNPAYPDTMYVSQLAAQHCVNTMPEKTMNAYADHGETTGDTITPNVDAAIEVMSGLKLLGIDMNDVVNDLEVEGVDKFIVSWGELMETVQKALDQA